jgi:two-component sensor histidine kinase
MNEVRTQLENLQQRLQWLADITELVVSSDASWSKSACHTVLV